MPCRLASEPARFVPHSGRVYAHRLLPFLCGVALIACGNGRGDQFIDKGGNAPTWAETPDHRVRFPLVPGLTWERVAPSKDSLLKLRASLGPTFVVVIAVEDAPKPIEPGTCAEAHRARVAAAAIMGGVKMTEPAVSEEVRHGTKVPRLHYAVALEAKGSDTPPASAMSAWTYLADHERCVAIGVTTVVKANASKPSEPDPEDLQRLERVYGAIADDAKVN